MPRPSRGVAASSDHSAQTVCEVLLIFFPCVTKDGLQYLTPPHVNSAFAPLPVKKVEASWLQVGFIVWKTRCERPEAGIWCNLVTKAEPRHTSKAEVVVDSGIGFTGSFKGIGLATMRQCKWPGILPRHQLSQTVITCPVTVLLLLADDLVVLATSPEETSKHDHCTDSGWDPRRAPPHPRGLQLRQPRESMAFIHQKIVGRSLV